LFPSMYGCWHPVWQNQLHFGNSHRNVLSPRWRSSNCQCRHLCTAFQHRHGTLHPSSECNHLGTCIGCSAHPLGRSRQTIQRSRSCALAGWRNQSRQVSLQKMTCQRTAVQQCDLAGACECQRRHWVVNLTTPHGGCESCRTISCGKGRLIESRADFRDVQSTIVCHVVGGEP